MAEGWDFVTGDEDANELIQLMGGKEGEKHSKLSLIRLEVLDKKR
jgi:hypothetical protein